MSIWLRSFSFCITLCANKEALTRKKCYHNLRRREWLTLVSRVYIHTYNMPPCVTTTHKIIINQLETMEMFCIWSFFFLLFDFSFSFSLGILHDFSFSSILVNAFGCRIYIFYHVCLLMRCVSSFVIFLFFLFSFILFFFFFGW